MLFSQTMLSLISLWRIYIFLVDSIHFVVIQKKFRHQPQDCLCKANVKVLLCKIYLIFMFIAKWDLMFYHRSTVLLNKKYIEKSCFFYNTTLIGYSWKAGLAKRDCMFSDINFIKINISSRNIVQKLPLDKRFIAASQNNITDSNGLAQGHWYSTCFRNQLLVGVDQQTMFSENWYNMGW